MPELLENFHFSLAPAEHQNPHEKEKGSALESALGTPCCMWSPCQWRIGRLLENMEGDVFPVHSEA